MLFILNTVRGQVFQISAK